MFRFSKHFLAEPSNKLPSERSGTGFPEGGAGAEQEGGVEGGRLWTGGQGLARGPCGMPVGVLLKSSVIDTIVSLVASLRKT